MNIKTAFPSKHLKAVDADDDLLLTIKSVKIESVGQGAKAEQKPVVYFNEIEKGLVLNKTNATMIARIAKSEETADWAGVQIRLVSTEVEFQGDMVPALRVREVKKKGATAPVTAPDEDDVPF